MASSARHGDDFALPLVPLSNLVGCHLVIEEKLDGSNCAISFDASATPWLQSRGHYLLGGPRERHFAQLKSFVATHRQDLYAVLSDRYVLYGEYLAAKHTIWYDSLEHYFYEFDVFDKLSGCFLSTPARRALLASSGVVSVPVLFEGVLWPAGATPKISDLWAFIGPSLYKSPTWRDKLVAQANKTGQDPSVILSETDPSDLSEGIYIKIETKTETIGRAKLVRSDFVASLTRADAKRQHWLDRPHLANHLRSDV